MNTATEIPRWAADILANPPQSGGGFHNWLFRAACALLKCGRTEEDIRAFLENAALNCGRRVSCREIDDAVRNSRIRNFRNGGLERRSWPSVNAEQRDAIVRDGLGLVDLWEASPIQLADNAPHTEQIIDVLFPNNPLLCCAAANHSARTARRNHWRGQMSELQFMVPNSMNAPTGLTQSGEISERCLGNTGPRRFIVVEFDVGTADEHAALLLHVAERAPLALAVFSGSKSLHGWFYCEGIADEKVLRLFRYAVSLGADRATWPARSFEIS